VRLLQKGAMASNVADNEKLTLFFEKKMSTVGLLAANALQGPQRCGLGGTITVIQKCDHYS